MQDLIARLLRGIELEEKEQAERYRLDQQHSLKAMKAEGLALHPLTITRKSYGYAEYPEVSFRLSFPAETQKFRDGTAIECFFEGQEPVKAMLLEMDGNKGVFRLYAPDHPDWIEDAGVGIKLAPDTRTTEIMRKCLQQIPHDKKLSHLFMALHGLAEVSLPECHASPRTIAFRNPDLNISQQTAVRTILEDATLTIIHGPPGTGKTTTLVEAIVQRCLQGEKLLVSAPSNAATDNITRALIRAGIRTLRVGNTGKVEEDLQPYTIEGLLNDHKVQKELKDLRIRAAEFRRMALKYKRSFGPSEREQRALLLKEVKSIRTEIRALQNYHEQRLMDEASVITGTPIGLYDADLSKHRFSTLVIDEAGQCTEPLAWCLFPLADKFVLAGDHWQLPPTVLSQQAAREGLSISILEQAIDKGFPVILLNTQYRMRKSIAGFSSGYFYHHLLETERNLEDKGIHLTFIDTAGSGYHEKAGPDGGSLENQGELDIVLHLLEEAALSPEHTAFITPYAGQAMAARARLPKGMRISTIDSFQGQEMEHIIISLVRSNDENDIGFLKDYRRMNVALTRAKEQLFVIGDSATIGSDPFYAAFLSYVDSNGSYRSVWEFGPV